MISKQLSYSKGFSAVELLIALIVASVFLVAGHQLYAAINNSSSDSRQRAIASSVADSYFDKYSPQVDQSCSASTKLNNDPVTPEPYGIKNVKVTVKFECIDDMPEITSVHVKVTYGQKTTKEVSRARYISKI